MKFNIKTLFILTTLVAIIGCVNNSKKENETVIKKET